MKTSITHIHERANAESGDTLTATTAQPAGTGPARPRIDFNARYHNRQLATSALLTLLREQAPDLFARAEVVGAWVWIAFPDKQPREVTARLALFGFHWNNKRQVWQHPCGKETQTPFNGDPRDRYGSLFPSQTAN